MLTMMKLKLMNRRVVITGMGIWSCLGTDLNSVKESLYNGKSGIGLFPERLEYGYRSGLSGVVETPVITKQMLDRHTRAGMSEEAKYAYMASLQAFEQANISESYLKENEVGCIFGNDSSAKPVIEASKIMDEKHDSAMLGYGIVFQSMNSTVNMNLSSIFHLRGVNFTLSAACASGSHSIGIGYMLIKQGLQDLILCGGAQETNYYSMASFDALGAFSVRMDDPTKASRPFDKDRDGLVPSGGAAALVLEEYEHAVKRGAKIYGEICGYGSTCDAHHITAPHPEARGGSKAMKDAMKEADYKEDDKVYINAHGTGTPMNDVLETLAIKLALGEEKAKDALISSTKSMTGHMLGAAGAIEAMACLMALKESIIPPTLNLNDPDEKCDLNYVPNKAVRSDITLALSNSLGFGGHNACLAFRKV